MTTLPPPPSNLIRERIPTALGLGPGYLERVTGPRGGLRYYTLPNSDREMDSVTSIMEQTINKPALQRWREALIRKGESPQKVSKKARDIGTRLHKAIEDDLNMDYPLDAKPWPDDLLPAMDAFYRWRDKENLDFVESEVSVFQEIIRNEMYVAGTLDALFKVTSGAEDGSLVICDFKTSSSKNVYPEACLQIAAYTCALYSMGCNDEISGRVLSFTKDKETQAFTGAVQVAKIPADALRGWAVAFDACVTLWAAMNTDITTSTL